MLSKVTCFLGLEAKFRANQSGGSDALWEEEAQCCVARRKESPFFSQSALPVFSEIVFFIFSRRNYQKFLLKGQKI